MSELLTIALGSFWSFIGVSLLVGLVGYWLVYVPLDSLIKLFAVHSLKKLGAKKEIAVMGGLSYENNKEKEAS